jgi:broad specificity phosphatase PhoE
METNTARRFPRLFLIRHGSTDWSDSHQHTGRTDIALNAVGEAQARDLATQLRDASFTRVLTSPLVRARRTCEIAGFAERAEATPDLVEWDYGDYEGRRTDDIHRERPDWNLFKHGAPGGESPEEVAARADQFIRFARSIAGDVAAFSSGHIIRMIGARWLGLAPVDGQYLLADTASVSILGYEHNLDEPVVMLWNDRRRSSDSQVSPSA